MYLGHLERRDRALSIAIAAAVHVALIAAFLQLGGTVPAAVKEELIDLITIAEPPPPPEPVAEVDRERAQPKKQEGAASPKNVESQATPVAAPQPRIALPVPPPIPVSKTPREGNEPTQGAAPVAGPGTGAGGIGTGTGSGGSGAGPGGGGEGLAMVRTRLATRPLSGRDFPPELLDRWPPGRQVLLRFRVDATGAIIQCDVFQGSGDPSVDAQVCAIARQRLRYRPGLDRNRQRVADWAAYGQRPPR